MPPASRAPAGSETGVAASLRLEPLGGASIEPVVLEPAPQITIGRARASQVTLPDDTVSRAHAVISNHRGRWFIRDVGSRHGTVLNGQILEAGRPQLLGNGDLLRIGPYGFRVSFGAAPTTLTRTIAEAPDASPRIETVAPGEMGGLARHRLDLLIECAAMIHGAGDEPALAEAVLESALAGTGFHHAALLRPHGGVDEIEVIGHRSRGGGGGSMVSFSRSLIAQASTGEVVRLTRSAELPVSVSIAELGITAALCAPIMLGPSIAAYLYLDARGQPARLEPDAGGFCQLIARMCGLALANIKRIELERRHHALQSEIEAAREAQRLIVPVPDGRLGPIRYAMQMRPGRFVAGDLFDLVLLDEHRVAVCIGDVTGEGVGAGVIMTACQAHLHAELLRGGDPLAATIAVNRYLTDRLPGGKFISLWVGVIDRREDLVRFVDAGHGYFLHKPVSAGPRRIEHVGCYPLGIEIDAPYRCETFPFATGDRLILCSDGLVEQRSPDQEQFGWDRVAAAIETTADCTADVAAVMATLETFAGRAEFDDDTTVAAVERE